jgi:hypothetical protein
MPMFNSREGHMRSSERQQRRREALRRRIASVSDDHMPRCTVPDPNTGNACGRPTTRAAKKGLSAFTCRYHQQHKQRHGSYWAKRPTASVLNPYISAALSIIRERRTDPFINAALAGVRGIMASAGPVEIATRLRGLSPEDRAKIALARLREANIKPERLLAIAVAVHALIEDAPEKCHRIPDWRIVAIAKAAHRLASGTHRQWPVAQPDGRVKHIEMHAYPRSSGRVLRHLGEMIEKESELVIAHHLPGVLFLKRTTGPEMAAQEHPH